MAGRLPLPGGALPAVALQVLLAGTRPRFLAVVDHGATVAICRVASDEGWMGTGSVYLQTEDTNVAARALYERAGFAVHHSYRYHRPAGVSPAAPPPSTAV